MVAYAKSLSALNQARRKEQAVTKLHTAASAKSLSNLADSAATNGLLSVLDQWQAAKEKRKQAEQAAESSQNTLASAQQKLTDNKQRTMADLRLDVKKEIDQKVSAHNRSVEFESIMQDGSPFQTFPAQTDNPANLQAQKDMKDHFQSLSPQDQTIMIDLIKKYRTGWISDEELKILNDLNPDFMPDLPMPEYTGQTISALVSEQPKGDMRAEYNSLLRSVYFHTATQQEKDRLAYLDSALTTEEKYGPLYGSLQNVADKWPDGAEKEALTFNPDTQEVELGKIKSPFMSSLHADGTSQREKNRRWMLDELKTEYDRLQKNLASGAAQSQEQGNLPRTQEELDRWYANQKQVIEETYSMESLAIPTPEMMDAFQKQWDSWTPEERNTNALLINATLSGSKFDLDMGSWMLGRDAMEKLYIDSLRNYYMMLYARSGGKSMESTLMDGVIQGIASAIPEGIMASMTAGMSALPTTGSLKAYGPDMYNAYNSFVRSMQSLVQNPKFASSFVVQNTSSYQDVMKITNNEFMSAAYAWMNGFFGAAADINGAFLVDDTAEKSMKKFVMELGKKGGNEAVKGLTSKLNAMLTYDKGKDIFSLADGSALLNPQDMTGDSLTGIAADGIESGSKAAINTAVMDLSKYVQESMYSGLISEKTGNEFLTILAKMLQKEMD